MLTPRMFNTSLVDNQTGKEVFTSSLASLRLAGWYNFQDTQYSQSSPLTLNQNVETRVLFDGGQISFEKKESLPRIGSQVYPLWDFDSNVFKCYKENSESVYDIRLQMIGRSTSAASGVGLESIIRIPNGIAILRESSPLIKGTDWQRLAYRMIFYVEVDNIEEGLQLWLQPFSSNIQIYNINMLIQSGA